VKKTEDSHPSVFLFSEKGGDIVEVALVVAGLLMALLWKGIGAVEVHVEESNETPHESHTIPSFEAYNSNPSIKQRDAFTEIANMRKEIHK
jgi:hypothetical protein